nr:PREDICTED: gamma-secretase subunit pen-2 [Bemisia tabaci]
MKIEKKLAMCKLYFYGGFLFLPLLWLINVVSFFKISHRKSTVPAEQELYRFVVMSGVGVAVWTVILSVWIYTYQTNRVKWGDFGDDISFLIPTGS